MPGVTETNKNVGINAPSNARLTITTSAANWRYFGRLQQRQQGL
ncbi:hypothetical protein RNAN_1954 [Rheinheimera nanhaiensis E407-8]|uniref:Uncharacterized protein n=1 Tax=Rheinheimera nanhaiensis E407-8 TaxID=562729 RepID=I1DY38_9GAMM|nr:hypothetical protein RNAN_1954 [Rheinheimera nanhaiensis E407-8]